MARERGLERVKGKDQDEGGWIPVIKNHRAQANSGDRTQETYTLFVDNIPGLKLTMETGLKRPTLCLLTTSLRTKTFNGYNELSISSK
ncbi:hypothetical protein RHGRI_016382 [Rhododendron griersonianum]|uniref:Uncharacterized protein n=1 Tax=Rhododendron griersonianum TaxID=479676 RepID=A0AAV6JTX8_9ERIC|nr:hypothetical protein RHGRI_016382 [Rhododendron griersonianum]